MSLMINTIFVIAGAVVQYDGDAKVFAGVSTVFGAQAFKLEIVHPVVKRGLPTALGSNFDRLF